MTTTKPVRVRFAPSPTGKLHIGGARTAIYNWAFARANGGTFILRIDDTDPTRSTDENTQIILRAMRWLGLDWDSGAFPGKAPDEFYQSRRSGIYKEFFEKLSAQNLIYPCFCSRAELHAASAPHTSDGQFIYPGTCRNLTEDERRSKMQSHKHSWRIKVPDETITFNDRHYGRQSLNLAREWGDFIVRRSDGVHAYQLAVTVDDALMGVTEVVRGRDLLPSTGCQIQLFHALGHTPPHYGHIPLLVNRDGRRLSKRERDLDIGVLRTRFTPEELLGRMANLLDRKSVV